MPSVNKVLAYVIKSSHFEENVQSKPQRVHFLPLVQRHHSTTIDHFRRRVFAKQLPAVTRKMLSQPTNLSSMLMELETMRQSSRMDTEATIRRTIGLIELSKVSRTSARVDSGSAW